MNDEKWQDLKDNLENRFGEIVTKNRTEEHEDDVGHVIKTKIESLEFVSDMGRLKIERITRPKILDKKSHYHHAGVAKVEYILSKDELTHKLNVFKLNEAGDWETLDLPAERLSF